MNQVEVVIVHSPDQGKLLYKGKRMRLDFCLEDGITEEFKQTNSLQKIMNDPKSHNGVASQILSCQHYSSHQQNG